MRTLVTVAAALAAVVGTVLSFCLIVTGSARLGAALAALSVAPGIGLAVAHARRKHRPFERELAAVRALKAVPPPLPVAVTEGVPFPRLRHPETAVNGEAMDAEPPSMGPPPLPPEPPTFVPREDRAQTMLPPAMSPEARRAQMRLVHTDGRRLSPTAIRRRPPKW